MGKIKETKISRFSGGKSEDLRTQSSVSYSLAQHFDITNAHRLIPYRAFEAEETFGSGTKEGQQIVRFAYVNGSLFGYGRNNGTDKNPKLFEISGTLGGNWTASSDGSPSNDFERRTEVFFGYKKKIYGFDANGVWSYDTTNDTFNESDQSNIGSIASSDVLAEPVQHPGDDIAYFFHNNEVHKLNDATWSPAAVFTLPSNLDIVSADAWGNYLAIAQRPTESYDKMSVISFWNRDESQTTASEEVQFTDRVQHIANLRDRLISVGSSFEGEGDSDIVYLYIRNATTGSILKQYRLKAAFFTGNKIVDGDVLYFLARITDENGETQEGVWAVRSDGTLTLDRKVDDVSGAGLSARYQGIYKTANRWWVAHSSDGSIDKTAETETYTNTSAYESIIFTGGDSSIKKRLKGITVTTEPMPTDGQIVVKYRTDADITNGNNFTTIKTFTGDDSIEQTATRPDTETNFKEYREVQFRIESTGGATITGFKFRYEEFPQQYE